MKFNVVLNPGMQPKIDASFELDKFFVGWRGYIENETEGYRLTMSDDRTCVRCSKPIEHQWSSSFGEGGGECACSLWQTAISPYSGSSYVTEEFRRVRPLTPAEKAQRRLNGLSDEEKAAMLAILQGAEP